MVRERGTAGWDNEEHIDRGGAAAGNLRSGADPTRAPGRPVHTAPLFGGEYLITRIFTAEAFQARVSGRQQTLTEHIQHSFFRGADSLRFMGPTTMFTREGHLGQWRPVHTSTNT
jgi:hypothetical protein